MSKMELSATGKEGMLAALSQARVNLICSRTGCVPLFEALFPGELVDTRISTLFIVGPGVDTVKDQEWSRAFDYFRGGLMLIANVDALGLHHSVLRAFWRIVAESTTQYGVQLVTSTQSRECIYHAHAMFSGLARHAPYDFRYHRLNKVDQQWKLVTYDQDTLEAAFDMDLEIR